MPRSVIVPNSYFLSSKIIVYLDCRVYLYFLSLMEKIHIGSEYHIQIHGNSK